MMTTSVPEPPIVQPATVRPASIPAGNASARDKAVREVDQIARILVAGYADTPQGRWLIADRDRRLITFGVYWPAMVRYALRYGLVDVAVDSTGAVIGAGIWFDTTNPGDPDVYRRSLADVCGEDVGRFLRYEQLLAGHQPDPGHNGPGWRLAWLAVAAPHRGIGVGSALLRYRHATLDTDGAPAVLTAISPRARNLFTRHGYRRQGRVLRLPAGPSMWPMVRQPHNAGAEPGDDALPIRATPPARAGHDPGG